MPFKQRYHTGDFITILSTNPKTTTAIAKELGCSRNTVERTLAQLVNDNIVVRVNIEGGFHAWALPHEPPPALSQSRHQHMNEQLNNFVVQLMDQEEKDGGYKIEDCLQNSKYDEEIMFQMIVRNYEIMHPKNKLVCIISGILFDAVDGADAESVDEELAHLREYMLGE